jgi:hypothetical protein
MTRELNFRTNFSTQFTTQTSLQRVTVPDINALAPSQFPSYAIALGTTHYQQIALPSSPISGYQEFTLTLYFMLPQLSLETMLHYRSDYLAGVEFFFGGGYVPPLIQPGENYRIQSISLVDVVPPVLHPTATRFSLALKARYDFTIL